MLLKKVLKTLVLLFMVVPPWACAAESPNILDAILAEDISGFNKAIKRIENPTFYTDKLGTKHILLGAAAYSKNLEFTKQLIAAGADVGAENQVGETALFDTIIACNIPAAKMQLEKGAHLRHKNSLGFTPLHSAALSQCPDIVKLFLQYGADKSIINREGLTAYELALKMKNARLAAELK